jgi:RNA polymerase sigma factor (sigma-70 family)
MQRDLVVRAQRGEHDAFAALAAAMITRLDGTARLILRDPDRAADAVQEALIRAWRELRSLRDPDRFEAWCYRLVVNACYDEGRRDARRRRDVSIDAIAPLASSDDVSAFADRDEIERAFRRLEPEQRAVLACRHYLELSVPEIADALGIPEGTVKSRLSRAAQALRASLAADARSLSALATGSSI